MVNTGKKGEMNPGLRDSGDGESYAPVGPDAKLLGNFQDEALKTLHL